MKRSTQATEPSTPATMRDVARLAGVDPSVVSRLLNDDPRLSVSASTRQRVLEAIEQLDYRPNAAARALRTSRSRLIAVVVPDLVNPVYAQLVEGVQAAAAEHGYGMVMASSQALTGERPPIKDLSDRVDGVLVAAGALDDEAIAAALQLRTPTVFVNRVVADERARSVTVDNETGAALAAEHLLELGHRRCVVMTGPSGDNGVGDVRRDTFTRHLVEGGGTARTLAAAALDAGAGYRAARELFTDEREFTALYAVNLRLAAGVLRALSELGVDVPGDVSLVAMHEAELAVYSRPSLTTVALPMRELGAAAFDIALRLIRGEQVESHAIGQEPLLIPRESTGPASS